MNKKFDYFSMIENKYRTNINKYKPLIVRFDGKNVCGNDNIDLRSEEKGSFGYALKKTGEILSKKYDCSIYVGSDEINMICQRPNNIIVKFDSNSTQKIATLLVQDVFLIFNRFYKKKPMIFFDARCFSIPNDKILSYLLYRKASNINVLTNYFAKKELDAHERFNLKLSELNDLLSKKCKQFNERTTYQKEGLIYKYGYEFTIDKYIKQYLSLEYIVENTNIPYDFCL